MLVEGCFTPGRIRAEAILAAASHDARGARDLRGKLGGGPDVAVDDRTHATTAAERAVVRAILGFALPTHLAGPTNARSSANNGVTVDSAVRGAPTGMRRGFFGVLAADTRTNVRGVEVLVRCGLESAEDVAARPGR